MSRRLGVILLAATSLAAAGSPVAAAERRLEIASFVGLRSGESLGAVKPGSSPAEADTAPSWGVSVGWWVRPDGWFEVLFDRQRLELESASPGRTDRFELDVDYLQFGGGYEPPRQGLRPFVTVAVGLSRYGSDPGSVSSSTGLSGSVGGGVKVPMGKRVLFRFEARGWGAVTAASAEVACGPGCSFSFSGSGWWQLGLRTGIAFTDRP